VPASGLPQLAERTKPSAEPPRVCTAPTTNHRAPREYSRLPIRQFDGPVGGAAVKSSVTHRWRPSWIQCLHPEPAAASVSPGLFPPSHLRWFFFARLRASPPDLLMQRADASLRLDDRIAKGRDLKPASGFGLARARVLLRCLCRPRNMSLRRGSFCSKHLPETPGR
jgi:hypothetical protein